MKTIAHCLTMAAGLMVCAATAHAADDRCDRAGAEDGSSPMVDLRIDNDLFANQDQGYTSGILLGLVSPNLANYTDDRCLPAPARWLNSYLDWLQPRGFDQQNMVVRIGQQMYTPVDFEATELIENDRPYAGIFLVSLGYNARENDRLRSTTLDVGMLGPSSYAEQSQDFIHDLIGSEKFNGWDNQLRDEVVFRIAHERARRFPAKGAFGNPDGFGVDAIRHYGLSVGTLATYANVGGEVRFGWKLPDDFGTSPLRPAGENSAPSMRARFQSGWSVHGFVSFDGRLVLRDVTLDGNTWKSSHSVDKEPLVSEAALGMAIRHGRWKFAYARYFRTREFEGQAERPSYGSFTVSAAL
jgi:lipid A 3-O-deacylase